MLWLRTSISYKLLFSIVFYLLYLYVLTSVCTFKFLHFVFLGSTRVCKLLWVYLSLLLLVTLPITNFHSAFRSVHRVTLLPFGILLDNISNVDLYLPLWVFIFYVYRIQLGQPATVKVAANLVRLLSYNNKVWMLR